MILVTNKILQEHHDSHQDQRTEYSSQLYSISPAILIFINHSINSFILLTDPDSHHHLICPSLLEDR